VLALIDTDILLYEIGSYTDDEGHPLPWPLCKSRADAKVIKIMEAAGCDDYHLYLTGDNNFRIKEGTIKPYKGHRTSPKPHNYANLKKYFSTSKNFEGKVTIADGYEADDSLSIEQMKNMWRDGSGTGDTVLCSRDKDLNMVPGHHYSWGSGGQKEKEVWCVTREEGYRWFFTQLITGDATDNIPGLYGLGAKSTAVTGLRELTEPLSMYAHVQKRYEDRFGSYWKMFMHENARLLWMMRTEDDDVRVWLDSLEVQRQDELYDEEEETY
jgi:hypothetical protein